MNISIVCSNLRHPVRPRLQQWQQERSGAHRVDLVQSTRELAGGDLLLLISCAEIVTADTRSKYQATLVVHASDLPLGRGWSPHVWQILEGKTRFAVTLIEAVEPVDTGSIWAERWVDLEGHELYDEINARLFDAELALMDDAVDGFGSIRPRPQDGRAPTVYRKRTPADSRLDPQRTLAEQFDLLRVCDPERFPAFLEHRGHRYDLILRKKK